jgi:predicted TIM-barrel fold metal-dependent hydrolase
MSRYAGPIIDPHHHLWDLRLARHPWLAAPPRFRPTVPGPDPLRQDYLPPDYLADVAGQNIVASVHVEAGWQAEDCLGETRWLEGLAKPSGIAARYVAHVPLASPEAPALIEAQAACPRVAGVRDILSWHADPEKSFVERRDRMDDPTWRAGLRHLARHGLSFDLMLFPGQLGDAARLARAFPDQLFVLNHCGSPIDRDADSMQEWRDGLRALAAAPNVMIKISDLVAYDHSWALESLRPVVLHCIDCFGPRRAMFGSDFPVAKLWSSARDVWESFRTIVAEFSADEQTALFFATAQRVYRVPELGVQR